MTDLVGQYLGRYYLTERLGEGGMATVYKAYDTRLERDVAVKIIRKGAFPPEILDQVLIRFEREAKSLARLSHPNIVKVYDYGEHDGSPYLVMEYLPGGTLKKIIGKPVPWQEALRLLLPIARGVDYAHRHGILHRDIKSANILITDDGEPMLSDFGIAKLFEAEQTSGLTRSGMAIGTPEYMAPEQWSGKANPQSDQYSLGIVLYEMLTGRKPYVADTPAAIAIKQATEPLPSPRDFVADLPEKLELVLIKTLARQPGDRYEDIKAFIGALEDLQVKAPLVPPAKPAVSEEPPKAPPPEPVIPPPAPVVAKGDGGTVPAFEKPPPASPDIPLPGERLSPAPGSEAPAFLTTRRVFVALGVIGIVFLVIAGFPFLQGIFAVAPIPSETPPVALERTSSRTRSASTATLPPSPTSTQVPIPTRAVFDPHPDSSDYLDAQGVPMRLVPAGDFSMGSENGNSDEKPAHTVYLDEFYMDKYEVTNGLYKACVEAGACDPPADTTSYTRSTYYGNAEFDNYPVIRVDWNQAAAYCGWREGKLPSEAQWEKAARGTDGRTYPWGEGIDKTFANYNSDIGDTTGVGSYESGVSPYGIYDMAGNVWEWVADWYDAGYYATLGEGAANPQGPDTGQVRVLRGGSWNYFAFNLRASIRLGDIPVIINDVVGFRCSRSP